MREDLMRELRRVTEEEEQLLAGGQVDKSLYTSGGGFLIDSDKLLAKGKLITVRPHTRFAAFPMHTHNYVEIMYMCSGQTIHQIEGRPPLTLRTGELLFLNQHASHAVERAGEEDVGVNFIVLPQFFDVALNLIGTDNVLGKFLLSGLRQSGGEMSCLHFRVAEAPTVQNLVENLVWSLVHPQPNARRINQATMGLLLLQLLNYTEDLEEASGNGAVRRPAGDRGKLPHRGFDPLGGGAPRFLALPQRRGAPGHRPHLQRAAAGKAPLQGGPAAAGDPPDHPGHHPGGGL